MYVIYLLNKRHIKQISHDFGSVFSMYLCVCGAVFRGLLVLRFPICEILLLL